MFIISDRVKETSTTSGSGSILLNGAYGAFQTFLDGIGDGSTTYYTIENNTRWEVGQGTYDAATNSLSRDIIFSSSQSDQKINLQGTSIVFCTLPAEKAFIKDPNSSVSANDIVSSGQANLSSITTNSIYVSGDSNFKGDTNVGGDHVVSGDLSVLGNSDLKNVSGEFLTLVRPNSAGNFLHAYKDDGTNQTVSLWIDSNTSPLWRFGLKNNPSSTTASPTFGYIFGRDGSVGSVSNTNNYFSIADTLGFSVFHEGNLVFRASSDTGVYINGKSALYPAFTIQGAPLNLEDLQRWEDYTGTVLSVIDSGGKVGILTDSPIYDLDVNGSGRLESIYLTSGIYFQDGTFQSTAQDVGAIVQDIEAVSGVAVYASGLSDQNAVDILTVSGIVGDSGVAIFASGLAVQNEIDIATVSGLLYDDTAISGYFESRADTNENQIIAVSGWADSTMDTRDAAVSGWAQAYVDSQDHSATAVSGWAGSYADAGDAAVSGWADSTMTSRDNAVSGWAGSYADAGDAAVSGWAQAYVDSQDHSATAVSGWAGSYADAGDAAVSGWADNTFNLQEVTDRGSNTTNSIFTSGNITATSGYFDTLDMTPLGNGSQPPHLEGRLFYDSENHTLSLYNDEADVTLQLGQEEFLRVRNNTGATITNGTAVLITGTHGSAAPTISGAIATSESSAQVVGLSTHDIEDSSFGYVTTYGIVRDVDTSQYSDGDEIFLSATQIGSGVNVSPTIPNYKVTIGHVIRSHGSNGSILVQIGNPKLGGGDLKSEAALNMSGVPFVTSISDTTAGGSQTDPLFVFDSGNRQLQVGSGIQLLDGVPSNTSNVLYNDSGSLYFNGSEVGGSESDTLATVTARGATTAEDVSFSGLVSINSPSGAAVPLTVISDASQSANLQEWQDDSGTNLAFIDSDGDIHFEGGNATSTSASIRLGQTNNWPTQNASVTILGANLTLDSTYAIVFDLNTGGARFVNGGAFRPETNDLHDFGSSSLKWKNAYFSQTVDTSGVQAHNLVIENDIASDVPVIVRGAVSQSANLQEWQSSLGTVNAHITANGEFSNNENGTTGSEVFGAGATANGLTNCTIIGKNASATGGSGGTAIAIGNGASAAGSTTTGGRTIAIGGTASFKDSVAIGGTTGGIGNVAVGFGTSTAGLYSSVAIGYRANDGGFGNNVVIGGRSTATAANQFVCGRTNQSSNGILITDVFFGNGVTNAAPQDYTYNGTGGNGTDVGGGDISLAGGKGTGSGVGGSVNVKVADSGVTGSGLNDLRTIAYFATTGVYINDSSEQEALRVQDDGKVIITKPGVTSSKTPQEQFRVVDSTANAYGCVIAIENTQSNDAATRISAKQDGGGFKLSNNIYHAASTNHDYSSRWGVEIDASNGSTGPNSSLSIHAKPDGTSTYSEGIKVDWTDTAGLTRLHVYDVDSSGLQRVMNNGSLLQLNGVDVGVELDSSSSAATPLIVRGAVSQSANLQEWQDSSDVVKAYIGNDGSISGESINVVYNKGIYWRHGGTQAGRITVDSSTMQFYVGSTRSFGIVGGGPVIGSGQSLQFSTSPTPNVYSIRDLSISREEAGVLRVSRKDTGQLGYIMVSGVMASGHVQLAENTPADTTNKLYNDGGTLKFNGSAVGGGTSYTAGSGITIDGADQINVHGGSGHFINLDVDGAFTATTKSFLIDHPSKSGMKLQYGSLEGPENGVYVRGTTSFNKIILPDYWKDLIDEETITVTLTPVYEFQPLFVKNKNCCEIEVGGNTCEYDYVVYAERKDVSKLEVEW